MDLVSVDQKGIIIVVFALFFIYLMGRMAKKFSPPSLRISSLSHFFQDEPTVKQSYSELPKQLIWSVLALVLLALIDPHFFIERKRGTENNGLLEEKEIPREGIALYLVLDVSGSMQGPLSSRTNTSKLDFLKEIVTQFIQGRPNDLLGLIAFARGATVYSPLTLDHNAILKKLQLLAPVTTPDKDGTAIGYAIYKTVNLIASTRYFAEAHQEKGMHPYDIKSVGLVLVTDGLQNPSELDSRNPLRNIELSDAAEFAKENHVKLYLINIGSQILENKYRAHRNVMNKMADVTDGKFYIVTNPSQLSEVFKDISSIEKSQITEKIYASPKSEQPEKYLKISLYPWLLLIAIVMILLAVFLETQWLKRIP